MCVLLSGWRAGLGGSALLQSLTKMPRRHENNEITRKQQQFHLDLVFPSEIW